MTALEVTALSKTYTGLLGRRGQQALRGVDLVLPRGAAFGLIGPNGAGKTTFIKLLLGIARPNSGTIRVLGGSPEDPEVRARIGYLPERLHLPASATPVAFLEGVARLKGLRVARSELLDLLAHVGLAEALGRKMGGFSKGMRQRAGLAAALLGKPDLLVLDEPTDGIDPMGRVEVRRILTAELKRGVTLFLNSHLLAETERLCDTLGILKEGRLVRFGQREALCRLEPRWRVRFAGKVDAQALEDAGFTRQPGDAWACEAPDAAALNAALDRARQEGALVVELVREAQDLEGVLADAMGAAA
ncbi:MAG: ABC transporter ATP-binding protein [Myxococcaceae bacterium]|nr:ABC transporter ATP-binding protein [Myxococcaceae bacterium]MCI0671339.1 ABC transporter ATP-binding protein [Myxococcaceae bacterium]